MAYQKTTVARVECNATRGIYHLTQTPTSCGMNLHSAGLRAGYECCVMAYQKPSWHEPALREASCRLRFFSLQLYFIWVI